MTFVNYKNSNNASSKLIADVSASATTLLIESGDEAIFPNEFPYLLTIEKTNSDWAVILREIVKVTSKTQNSFEVVRWAWNCVQDDTASPRTQGNTAHSFASWDRICLYRTSEQVKDIQNRLETSVEDSAIADEYDASATYEVWDVITYKGERYICNTAITTAEAFDVNKRTKTPVQTDIDTMAEDIEQLKLKSSASDHLEEDVLVWCYYELWDAVYPQNAPVYNNCSIEANIWDTTARTEVHIQRIWSWTASDELKLKLKTVWSPVVDLIVEVRRWTSVIDSARKLVQWYGDENEVIATGTVSRLDITSSFQEITVQLDNEFWETEWELLDVVLYQELSTVAADKYFVIACDSTQRSEPFQYLSVNWTSRIRSWFAPYCASDWFAETLLSKASLSWNYALPRNEKTLWEVAKITTFWKNVDWQRVYHEPDKEVIYDYWFFVYTIERTQVADPTQFFVWYSDDATGMTQWSDAFDDFFWYSWVRLNASWVETASVNLKDMASETWLTTGDNVMVKFPIRWIKLWKSNWNVVLSITDNPSGESEWYQYYAFSRWTLSSPIKKDKFYMWVYESSTDWTNLQSLSWKTLYKATISDQLTRARAIDSGDWSEWYDIQWYYQRNYIWALYMMKYGNPNSQALIWNWNVYNGTTVLNSWWSDSMSWTCAWDTSGQTSAVKLFGIENIWWNGRKRIWWASTNSAANLCVALSNFAASSWQPAWYEILSEETYTRNGVMKIIDDNYDMNKTMFMAGYGMWSNSNQFYCDQVYTDSGRIMVQGNDMTARANAGIFANQISYQTSTSSYSRLMYL